VTGNAVCDLSDHALELLPRLQLLRGRTNARLGRDLGRDLGCSKRQVSDAVRELRLLGYPVGSCADGYYWITDYAEAREVFDRHLRRARAHFRTAAMMRAEFPSLPPIEQLRMEV